MLGIVGERFPAQSGTAFSFVFAFALIGNMLLNYLMGLIVHEYGIGHLTTVSYFVIACMMVISLIIFRNNQSTINK